MFYNQLGQILPGLIVSLGITSGISVSSIPVITHLIDEAEYTSLNHANQTLKSSIQINHLLSRLDPNRQMIIANQSVQLKLGFPLADRVELNKLANLEKYQFQRKSADSIILWSSYQNYCFIYSEATNVGFKKEPARISDVFSAEDSRCNIESIKL